MSRPTIAEVWDRCRTAVPAWRDVPIDDVDFDAPKGFSSFTIGVRVNRPVDPRAVLYRHLAGKDNAILDTAAEKSTFLFLGAAGIAAQCLHYDETCRVEEFYDGRTLTADDVFDPALRRQIAAELFRLHQLEPPDLPERTFFELLHEQWGALAREVLHRAATTLPPDERALCADLSAIHGDDTVEKVRRCLPDRAPVFCHNDTYHGNVFLLDDGSVRLLDFEFACRNHIAFDFANLFAETVMEHGVADPPHFRIAAPRFTATDIAALVDDYLGHADFPTDAERAAEARQLVAETRRALLLSDYMYAMAALPLALAPIQKIRFIPYAHARFTKFLRAWDEEFGSRADT